MPNWQECQPEGRLDYAVTIVLHSVDNRFTLAHEAKGNHILALLRQIFHFAILNIEIALSHSKHLHYGPVCGSGAWGTFCLTRGIKIHR